MKWREIKKAIEQSGIREDDEILEIHCELHNGDKTLRPTKQGDFLRLNEQVSKDEQNRELAASAS